MTVPGLRIIAVKSILLAGALVLAVLGPDKAAANEDSPESALSDSEIKAIIDVACTQCHGLRPVQILRNGSPGWREIVTEMVLRGAQVSPAEADAIIDYLAQEYGPGAGQMQTGSLPHGALVPDSDAGMSSADIVLPEGEGMATVESLCQVCHDLGRVVTVRRTRRDWVRITENMSARGIPASAEEINLMVSYLATHYGKDEETAEATK